MKIPGKATISNRTSTMASQFARARAPYMPPTDSEFAARYQLLAIDPALPQCVYCGGLPTEWDHLFPMVSGSQWTGYFTEIANLVPSCGKCNQSRGAKPVSGWMRSTAPWSPFVRFQERDRMNTTDAAIEVERRIGIIEAAVVAQPPTKMMIDTLHDDEIELEGLRRELNLLLYRAEAVAARLRSRYQP